MEKYIIKKERMGGQLYYLIYQSVFFGYIFLERWNTEESASIRIVELKNCDLIPPVHNN